MTGVPRLARRRAAHGRQRVPNRRNEGSCFRAPSRGGGPARARPSGSTTSRPIWLRPGSWPEATRTLRKVARTTTAGLIYGYYLRLASAVDQACSAHEAAERIREASTATTRVRLVPMDRRGNPMPLTLGMLLAHVQAHKGGVLNEHYQLVPQWLSRPERFPTLTAQPGIFLFSNYIWSHGQNLTHSEALKRLSPHSLLIHGGPDTPKYQADVDTYFRENPSVDIAVHGEGEETLAELLEALVGTVRGWVRPTCRHSAMSRACRFGMGERVVHTAAGSRLVDLDAIPSPFLAGMFDVHAAAGTSMAIIETNRGCPYGCTFCDWGSATLSRIRKFDLGRVYVEFEWCAQHEIPSRVYRRHAKLRDHGTRRRDRRDDRLAEGDARIPHPRFHELREEHHQAPEADRGDVRRRGDTDQGLLSLQSMDEGTLKTVKRSNIKTEKYDELAHEFRQADLPLFVDLMLGLPGATQESFRRDLQGCIDREVTAKVYPTELLVNSPMNEPGYREMHRIETSAPLGALAPTSRNPDGSTKRALVVATASFTRADYDEMLDLRRVFVVVDNFGVLRQVSRFVRQELRLPEIELYERLRLDARARPDLWPALAFTFRVVPFLGTAPVSWQLLIDEVRTYVLRVLGMPADDALDTVLRVQHALLPARGRTFPLSLDLPHDYGAWHRAMVDVKDAGGLEWEDRRTATARLSARCLSRR